MHKFHYIGGSEMGMGGPVIGSIFCDEVLISNCVNDPVFFPEQQICVFLLMVEGRMIHRGIKPLMAFHAPTGEVWSVDPAPPYGWLRSSESIFPQVALRIHRDECRYDVRTKASPTGNLRMDLMNAPACGACREVRKRWTCTSCAECTKYIRSFWSGLFPEIGSPEL